MARSYCDHCCESYDEDNLVECSRCGRDVCYRCVVHAAVPGGVAASWWCNRCLMAAGRRDTLRKAAGQAEYHPSGESSLALETMKRMGLLSKPGTIKLPTNEEDRDVLMRWLELLGFNVAEDSEDFLLTPGEVPANGELRLTPDACARLSAVTMAANREESTEKPSRS